LVSESPKRIGRMLHDHVFAKLLQDENFPTQFFKRFLCLLSLCLLYAYLVKKRHLNGFRRARHRIMQVEGKKNFTITEQIHARSLANFYCQYADRQMNLKFMRRVSERERAIQFVIVKNKLMSVFYASVLLLTVNFVITLSK